jgi:hypothetical protein
MADNALSALTAASAIDADDLLYVVEDGNSRKLTIAQLAAFLATNAVGLPGFRFVVDTSSTASSDPTATFVKFNHATLSSVTAIYIDDQTVDGVDLSTLFGSLGTSGLIKFTSLTDPSEWVVYKWTAALTDNTGWWSFGTVVYQAGTGTFEDDDEVQVSLVQLGTSGGSTQGLHDAWIGAGSWYADITAPPIWSDVDGASNQPDWKAWSFDQTTVQRVWTVVSLPKSYNGGTFTFDVHWRHGATTVNFDTVWGMRALFVRNDDTLAAAYGTAQTVTDTGGTTDDVYKSPTSSAITPAGTYAANCLLFIELYRDASNGSDTLAGAASLLGATIHFTTNADTDA